MINIKISSKSCKQKNNKQVEHLNEPKHGFSNVLILNEEEAIVINLQIFIGFKPSVIIEKYLQEMQIWRNWGFNQSRKNNEHTNPNTFSSCYTTHHVQFTTTIDNMLKY